MNALQAQKDTMTKELESKNIYAAINVDAYGEENSRRREQKEGHRQGTKEGKKEEFEGILDTLA